MPSNHSTTFCNTFPVKNPPHRTVQTAVGLCRFYLRLSHKYPTILLAGEVALALHGAVVLALGLIQDDSHPFPRGKEGVADVGHGAALPLADHLHQGAYFDGPAAPVRAHPAGLRGDGENVWMVKLEETVTLHFLSLLNTWQQIF